MYVEYNLMAREQMEQIREIMETEGFLGNPGSSGREFQIQSENRLRQTGQPSDLWEAYDPAQVEEYLQQVVEVEDGDKVRPDFTKDFPLSYQRPVIENHRRLMPKTGAYRDRFVQKYDDRPHLGRHFHLKSTKIDEKKPLYQNFADLRALSSNPAQPRKMLSSGNQMAGMGLQEGWQEGQQELARNPNRIVRKAE